MNYGKIIENLEKGIDVEVKPIGNSMSPMIKSRQQITLKGLKHNPSLTIEKDDAVFCKVKGKFYFHKVYGKKKVNGKDYYLIGNNKGYMNGWTEKVFAKIII